MTCNNYYAFADVHPKFAGHRLRDFAKEDESIEIARGENAIKILQGTDGFDIMSLSVDKTVVITAHIQPSSETDRFLFNFYRKMTNGLARPETFSIVETNLDTGGYSECTLISKAPDKKFGSKIGIHSWQFMATNWVDE